MPNLSQEATDLAKYTEKCAQRAAITSDRNKKLEAQRPEVEAGPSMARGSDDEMQITGSRENSRAAKSHSLGELREEVRRKETC
jgi:hypothetical protein